MAGPWPSCFSIPTVRIAEEATRERAAYIIRNSRLDADWSSVRRRTMTIAGRAISSLIQSQGIGDLYRIYLTTQRDGVAYNLAYVRRPSGPRTTNSSTTPICAASTRPATRWPSQVIPGDIRLRVTILAISPCASWLFFWPAVAGSIGERRLSSASPSTLFLGPLPEQALEIGPVGNAVAKHRCGVAGQPPIDGAAENGAALRVRGPRV